MPQLLHQLIEEQSLTSPGNTALRYRDDLVTYAQLWQQIRELGRRFIALGIKPNDRIGIYLPKVPEAVYSFFAAGYAGGVFVPINPLLKPAQVTHILKDCNVRLLVTSADRLALLADNLAHCTDLQNVVCIAAANKKTNNAPTITQNVVAWEALPSATDVISPCPRIDVDMAAILYTSGSTGTPKGVVLSHRNMMCGADSVASYLHNTGKDILLAILPFSFDYGLSQLTTAFSVGASVVLMDYLLPRDVIRALAKYHVTGLAAVPPLWNQLAQLDWPSEVTQTLRYITNSGGAMTPTLTAKLRETLPSTDIYLMYGLTEAFRSTYLAPDQIEQRPNSIGKAIPNAQVMIVRPDGTECDANEPGELIHRGSLVSMGYWNAPEKTAERFKPVHAQPSELAFSEIAVWSGDQAYRDAEGYLYFVSRQDEMIKTSGYRVSPTEVEEILSTHTIVEEVVVLGAAHAQLGQGIVAIIKLLHTADPIEQLEQELLKHCRQQLPNFMVPHKLVISSELPRNPNGKIDRSHLAREFKQLFSGDDA